jgi:hypothetical protein
MFIHRPYEKYTLMLRRELDGRKGLRGNPYCHRMTVSASHNSTATQFAPQRYTRRMSEPFRIKVTHILRFAPNTVLVGQVVEGVAQACRHAMLKSPKGAVPMTLSPIEINRKFVNEAPTGSTIAVMSKIPSMDAVADGFSRDNGGIEVIDLEIVAPAQPWWAFWR